MRLGFNTRVSFTAAGGPEQGLRDGIRLFQVAEELGYQSGWCYQRHFDSYLSAPLPFFAAVGQHTSRIHLGSAVIGMRYEDPVLLAEGAGTADLLTGGRLELAVSTGQGNFDAVFGRPGADGRAEATARLATFLAGVAGEPLHVVDDPAMGAPLGTELRVTPHSPGLRERIWYGSGHVASAVQAAHDRLRLITGTILHDVTDETFSQYQARLVAAYREAWGGPDPAPPVAVAASVLPGSTPTLVERYAAYDLERRTQGPGASRPAGALAPTALPSGFLMSPVFHGDPDQVTAAVLADPGLTAADELVLFLPPAFGLEENVQLLTDMAHHVAPHLGWEPGAA
jgi:alkanesulfonate monooxygenase SsuD/methylene tetrahydromethanopterin reductase-like flavin-dependent oxidoreductase (luciferase family)